MTFCQQLKKPAHRVAVSLSLCALTVLAASAHAQAMRPVKLVVPTSPGSSADIGARTVGDRLQTILGRTITVENKAGAGGSLAAGAVAAAEPNGETVGVLGNAYLLYGQEFPQSKFDPMRDVTPVAIISKGSNVLLVANGSRFKKLDDLVRAARAEPGKLSYGSAGVGSSTYHSSERLRQAAGLTMEHIPYKGAPELVHETLSGRLDFSFVPVSVALPQIANGKMRALAVSSGKRSALLPEVPTTVEAGIADSTYDTWLVALVPSKTPPAIQAELHKAFVSAVDSPAVKERFAALGVEPAEAMTLEAVRNYVRQEYTRGLTK